MKRIIIASTLLVYFASAAGAWDTAKNPDQVASIGWGLHSGKLPGFAEDFSRYTEFGADFRLPINNYLSLKADFAQTTVSNAQLGVPTTVNRIGGEIRVYLQDLR